MKKLLVAVFSITLFTLTMAEGGDGGGGGGFPTPPTYYCSITSQVVNIDDLMGVDQWGNPESMARVDFGSYFYNRTTRSFTATGTFYAYVGKDILPSLREAYFDPRHPRVYVNTESEGTCDGVYRGWITYVRSNPDVKFEW